MTAAWYPTLRVSRMMSFARKRLAGPAWCLRVALDRTVTPAPCSPWGGAESQGVHEGEFADCCAGAVLDVVKQADAARPRWSDASAASTREIEGAPRHGPQGL